MDKVTLSFERDFPSAITFPSKSSNRTSSTSSEEEYPYLSRTTLEIVTFSDALKVRVSKSETAPLVETIAFLPSAALAETAKSQALTTTGSSLSLHLAGHASVSVVHAITVIGSSQSITASFPSDLISINITYYSSRSSFL
ncbi:hypothetical protein J6V86_03225 [bacterium]|nr:hypothetical protein [bacterium]